MKRLVVLFVLFSLSFSIVPSVYAASEVYCPLCEHRDDDDPLYKKERQFYQKVKIIKDTYGDSIDIPALIYSVLYRYSGADLAYEREYDENFDSNTYKAKASKLKSSYGASVSANSVKSKLGIADEGVEQEEIEKIIENEKFDLLTLAALVMTDSNKNGQYSDVCFMKGLTGNRLVGNDLDDENALESLSRNFINFFTCASVGIGSILVGDTYYDVTDSYFVRASSLNLRYQNLANVCKNGYIGGLYSGVSKIEDKGKKENQKKVIAQQIIDRANYYRQRYGTDDSSSGGMCAVGNLNGNTQIGDLGSTLDERINNFGKLAQASYSQTGIFASLTIAQAIGETTLGINPDAFKTCLAESNNDFGCVKCRGVSCKSCSMPDKCPAGYQFYASIEEGINDRYDLFNNGYYEGWDSATTVEEQLKIISVNYCPSSDNCNYYDDILSIINDYDLKKWDVKGNNSAGGSCFGTNSVAGWSLRSISPTASDASFQEFEKSNGSSNRGQCVWYAKGRAFEILNDLKSKNTITDSQASTIKKLILGIPGNGGDIYDNSKNLFNTSNDIKKPKAGSFIVWKQPGNYGHVAVVEEVNSSTITVIGGYTSTGSCPNNWDCPKLEKKTMSLDEFYNSYGKNYNGGYEFSGYVYFLEPKEDIGMPSIGNSASTSSSSNVKMDENAKYGSSDEYVCRNGVAVKNGSSCFGNVNANSPEYQNRIAKLPDYYQHTGKAANLPVGGAKFGDVGCGTASMMAAYYMYTGDDFDVKKFVDDAVNSGYLSAAGSDSTMLYNGESIFSTSWNLKTERIGRDINSMIDALKQGKKVLYNVSPNSDLWKTSAGHYILFDHYNEGSDEIYIFDPAGVENRNGYFKSDYLSSHLLNYMNHDPVAVSSNGFGDGDDNCKGSSSGKLSGVVSCAKEQLGKEYVWGTHGPDTFDCSGLTYYCYNRELNVDITPSSNAQWSDTEHFTEVSSIDDLTPGDLIVSRGGDHVSIYIGDGQVIHASRPGVGVIQSDASSHTGPIKYQHYKG